MLSGQNIFAARQRIEPGRVIEILNRYLAVAISRSALIGKK